MQYLHKRELNKNKKNSNNTSYNMKVIGLFCDWFSILKENIKLIEQQIKAELSTCLKKFSMRVSQTNGDLRY